MSKGLDFLVNSIAEFDKITDRKYAMLIAGDGEYYEEIAKQIEELGMKDKILQLGYRTDTENILCGSDAYVNSSKCYEALSFAILEAMSKRLPIVATNAGGNGDIVNENTDCGFLVEYGDTKGFAEALNKLATDEPLRKRLAENAKQATKTVFNLEKVLLDTLQVYKNIVKNKKQK